jgi:hypothetical protein
MNFDDLFTAYYTLYRTEADIPNSDDDEYKIALPLANEAVNRWEHYDHTYWKELFTTLSLNDEPTTLSTGVTDYDTPDDFREAGGFIKLFRDGVQQMSYPILEPQQVQFQSDSARYAYFTGDQLNGYTLHLNPAPTSAEDGCTIDYVYYKTATKFTDGGDEVTEMADPYFIVHRMLANRFRGSRNPFATDAKADAENVLKTMQLANIAGNWANPIGVQDNSGSVWGG